MQVLLFVLAIVLFVGLVIAHELGHFLVAKHNGVEAEEFGIGYPPRAFSRKLKNGLELSLNWLPLGGFVRLRGEHDSADTPGSFGAASLWSKTKILLGGIVANLLAGVILLTILAWVGMPVLINKQTDGVNQFTVTKNTKITRREVEVGYVLPGSPAAQAGIVATDSLLSIDSSQGALQITTVDQLKQATKQFAGQVVGVTFRHSGQTISRQVRLLSISDVESAQKQGKPSGYLGVEPNPLVVQRSTWSAPVVAVGFSWQLIELTLKGISHAIGGLASTIAGALTGNHAARVNGQNQAENQVGGPVAIMKILWSSGNLGINFVLMIIAIISISLALVNILPIPALDGGRLAMVLISRGLLKRPLDQETEARIIGTSFALLMVLIILITIVDVRRS